jgi:nicotinate-nucleotide adenylyltransferase
MAGEEHGTLAGGGPRIGVLGGTFDPPHIAHLLIAQEARARLGLDVVLFVPASAPPHKRGHAISPIDDRAAMVLHAIADAPGFALSRVDADRPGPSYTVDTLRRLRDEYGAQATLDLLIGGDMLLDLPTWHDAPGVVAGADHIVAAHRPGYAEGAARLHHLHAALPDLAAKLVLLPVIQTEVSASEIRERVASSLPVRYLVPDGVITYIEEHGLYRAPGWDIGQPADQSDNQHDSGRVGQGVRP